MIYVSQSLEKTAIKADVFRKLLETSFAEIPYAVSYQQRPNGQSNRRDRDEKVGRPMKETIQIHTMTMIYNNILGKAKLNNWGQMILVMEEIDPIDQKMGIYVTNVKLKGTLYKKLPYLDARSLKSHCICV